MIDDATEDGPSDVQGPDMLSITAEVPGHGVLRRRVVCPLSMPGSGRRLVGRAVGFRHRRLDSDDVDDIVVVRWPDEVAEALEPFRPQGPGALRARAWRFLAGCGAVTAVGGILLTVVLLIGIVSTGGELFADLPPGFRPGVALAVSAGAVVLGLCAFAFCETRMSRALSSPDPRRAPR
ncbi:hypothetical protein [Nocardiopsis flavescens]|uniref:hypothetical protein n=1 Tax=Nocardiopsis flavescens TaxID=758803 RepID=UPI001160EB07|nr:hypothetical protein [Nocardiopsis flavescens]